jgi:hypothetical protein
MAIRIVPADDEDARPFIDYVQSRVGRRPAQRVLGFIQEWDVLTDELGREPTLDEYQRRWGTSRATAYNDQRLFQQAFPGERTPRRINEGLWSLRGNRPGPLLAAGIIETGGGNEPLKEGQVWLDGRGRFVRVGQVDGRRVHGALEDGQGWSRWSGDREALDQMRLVGGPDSEVWRVLFQFDGPVEKLRQTLDREGHVVDGLSTPDVDWEDGRLLRGGTVEARVVADSRAHVRRKLMESSSLREAGVDPELARVTAQPSR